MKAICLQEVQKIELKDVPKPVNASKDHLIIKMKVSATNHGDNLVIAGSFPPISKHQICGVSGVGEVVEIGENVPQKYKKKKVAVYSSLKVTEHTVGAWSEYTELHYLNCVILPDNVKLEEYSGSLVNAITPYAFLKQIQKEGHPGIISTAGNSATGRAMVGICLKYNIPLISIVRNEKGKAQLEELKAENILIQNDHNFESKLKELSNQLNTTAVFDGVGGMLLTKVANSIPHNSTIYTYGFLGGGESLSIHTSSILMKGLTIKGFGNFLSETVQNSENLEIALNDLSKIIDMPHFKTKVGKTFPLKEFKEALNYKSDKGEKAVFTFQ